MPDMVSSLPNATAPLKGSHLQVPGQQQAQPHGEHGYQRTVFPGKADQMERVIAQLGSMGFMPKDLIPNEVQWFYTYPFPQILLNEGCELSVNL